MTYYEMLQHMNSILRETGEKPYGYSRFVNDNGFKYYRCLLCTGECYEIQDNPVKLIDMEDYEYNIMIDDIMALDWYQIDKNGKNLLQKLLKES